MNKYERYKQLSFVLDKEEKEKLRNELFEENKSLIPYALYKLGLIKGHSFRHIDLRDVEQECAILLMDCLDKYDESRGVFASYYINQVKYKLLTLQTCDSKLDNNEYCVGGLKDFEMSYAGRCSFESILITKIDANLYRDMIKDIKNGDVYLRYVETDITQEELGRELGMSSYLISNMLSKVSRTLLCRINSTNY